MVTRIAHSSNLSAVLNYNEKKVSRNDAELIHASGFLKDTDRMNFYDKAERFQRLNELYPRAEVNMLHVSINFDRSEQLPNAQLVAIADRYMEGIGFKDQPYLVYQHKDAGHPHIHIVSNIIKADGKRIETHNLGKDKSEPTRKEIEKEFNLVRAEDSRQKKQRFELQPVDAQKVVYGNATETKAAMKQAIHEVFDKYKYASLPEYNAALRQYNVTADPGTKESRINKHGGLVYRVLDEQGNKVGVPIKASAFYFKPTLTELEKKYEKNAEAREKHLPSIRDRVDIALLQNPDSLRQFVDDLKAARIELVIRQNETGRVYGLTYVDKETKTVINGSDLGKQYSAGSILKQFQQAKVKSPKQHPSKIHQKDSQLKPGETKDDPPLPLVPGFNPKVPQVLSNLMQYDETFGRSPYDLEEDQKIRRHRLR
jgi:hypothetical protein